MDKFDKKVVKTSLICLGILVIALNLGTTATAIVLSLFGMAILTYVCWNMFNTEHNWFTFTMCFLLGAICLIGFYGCLSLSGHIVWFYRILFLEIIMAFIGAIYRKARA